MIERLPIPKARRRYRLSYFVWMALLLMLLCGCDRVELYSNLDEGDANEMQAILLRQGIDCEKTYGKELSRGLKVSKRQLPAAVEILKGYGYPKDKFTDLGTIFKKEGLVSSPNEDRIRYIYALSQEVAETISQIEGVVRARVHIVLPENDPLSEYFQPSSASVFVKYRQTIDIGQLIHPIKQLVVNSIEGLNYEKVSVVPFPCPVVSSPPNFTRIMGIEIGAAYAPRFRLLVYGLIFFLFVLMITSGYLLWGKIVTPRDPAADGKEKETPNAIAA
jgi:type III secretion protein J